MSATASQRALLTFTKGKLEWLTQGRKSQHHLKRCYWPGQPTVLLKSSCVASCGRANKTKPTLLPLPHTFCFEFVSHVQNPSKENSAKSALFALV